MLRAIPLSSRPAHSRPSIAALAVALAATVAGCALPPGEAEDLESETTALVGAWSSQNIGSVGVAGSWSEVTGTHTVKASGADIYGTADAFRFVYQDFVGDVTVTAKVNSLENKHQYTKAAVMIRQDLTAGAKNVATIVTPTASNKYRQQSRTSAGGDTTSVQGAATSLLPSWIRLERTGSTFRSYHSSNGTSFTLISTATVSMTGTVRVGLALTSHVNTTLATAVFSSVSFATPTPAAPTGLTATAGNNRVTLAWSAVTGATSYTVKRAEIAGGPYASLQTGLTSPSFVDTTAANGTTYYYVVTASSPSAEGPPSAQAQATPVAPPPPPAPASLTATAGNAQVALSWSASSGATSYTVKRAEIAGGPYDLRQAGLTATSFVDTTTANGTTYYYVVTASSANGESLPSPQAQATPVAPPPPPAPTGLTATPGNAQVALSWSASSGATSYTVKRAEISGGPYDLRQAGLTATSFVDTTAANGTTYYYVVTASSVNGESLPSAQAQATPVPPPPPAAPTGLTATPGNAQVALAWSASSGATSYTVKWGTAAGIYDFSQAGLTATSFTVNGLTNGTTYHFAVSASNVSGAGLDSAPASATPQASVAAVSPECQRWQTLAITRVSPATSAELDSALASAVPGTMIELRASTTYTASGSPVRFRIVNRSGTSTNKIYLCGPRSAVLKASSVTDGSYGLWLSNASHWVVDGFTVRTAGKGVMLDASSNNTLRYLHVHEIGDEAIHLRKSSSNNVVEFNLIENTGNKNPGFGEAIYLGSAAGNWESVMGSLTPDKSDFNTVRGNTTRTRSEGVDIKEGTTGGLIENNTIYGTFLAGSADTSADSCMEIKGKGYTIRGNTCDTTLTDGLQVKNQGSACSNAGTTCPESGTFNLLELNATNMKTPSGGTATGYSINVGSTAKNNTVKCNNTHTNKAASYKTNVTCVP